MYQMYLVIWSKALLLRYPFRYTEAQGAVSEAIRIRPKWYKAHSTLAAIYGYQHKHDLAISSYKEALKWLPKDDGESRRKYEMRIKVMEERKIKILSPPATSNGRKRSRENDEEGFEESPAKRRKLDEQKLESIERALREKLSNHTVSELGHLLELNQQKKSGRKEELIERCVDGQLNGAIPHCDMCKREGRGRRSYLRYNKVTGMYTCGGGYDERARKHMPCDFRSDSVQRTSWRTH